MFSRKDFRFIFRRIADQKSHVDKKTAHKIFSVAGKSVAHTEFETFWPENLDVIDIDRAWRVFQQLSCIDCESEDEIGMIAAVKITVDDVLEATSDENVVDKETMARILEKYKREDGFIDIDKFIRDEISLRTSLPEKILPQEDYPESPCETANYDDNQQAEMDVIGDCSKLQSEKRGFLVVNPELLACKFKIVATAEIECEVIIKLVENSDSIKSRFLNDIFVIVYNSNGLVGISKYLLRNSRYSTGTISVSPGDECLVISMGTSIVKKTSVPQIDLLDEYKKLTKRYKMTLMNLFDLFDFDKDGLLNRMEYDTFTVAGGDDKLTEEEWQVLLREFGDKNRDEGINLNGFINSFQVEASAGDEMTLMDMWASLRRLGYQNDLVCAYACGYDIQLFSETDSSLEPQLIQIGRQERIHVLEMLYNESMPDAFTTVPGTRVFYTEYYGLLMCAKSPEVLEKVYEVVVREQKNVKFNFIHGRSTVYLEDSEGDLVLIASFSATDADFSASLGLVLKDQVASSAFP